ncbi:MAG: hypothetical protein NT038_09195 [Euryarchaeota archaeon]|nr:hypothetical protein [Euryarchaeota archaeon]
MSVCDKLTAEAKAQMKEEIYLSAAYRSERHLGFNENYNSIKTNKQAGKGVEVMVHFEQGTIGDFHTHPILKYDSKGGIFINPDILDDFNGILEPNGVDIHTNLLGHLQFACIGSYHPIKKEYLAQCYELNYDDAALKKLTTKSMELARYLPENLQKEVAETHRITPNVQLYVRTHYKEEKIFEEYLFDFFGLEEHFIKNRCIINLGKGKTTRWEMEPDVDWKAILSKTAKIDKSAKPEW